MGGGTGTGSAQSNGSERDEYVRIGLEGAWRDRDIESLAAYAGFRRVMPYDDLKKAAVSGDIVEMAAACTPLKGVDATLEQFYRGFIFKAFFSSTCNNSDCKAYPHWQPSFTSSLLPEAGETATKMVEANDAKYDCAGKDCLEWPLRSSEVLRKRHRTFAYLIMKGQVKDIPPEHLQVAGNYISENSLRFWPFIKERLYYNPTGSVLYHAERVGENGPQFCAVQRPSGGLDHGIALVLNELLKTKAEEGLFTIRTHRLKRGLFSPHQCTPNCVSKWLYSQAKSNPQVVDAIRYEELSLVNRRAIVMGWTPDGRAQEEPDESEQFIDIEFIDDAVDGDEVEVIEEAPVPPLTREEQDLVRHVIDLKEQRYSTSQAIELATSDEGMRRRLRGYWRIDEYDSEPSQQRDEFMLGLLDQQRDADLAEDHERRQQKRRKRR